MPAEEMLLEVPAEDAIPAEIMEQLSQLPVMQRELASQSLRFVVFLIGLILLMLIGLASPYLPFLNTIPQDQIQSLGWQVVTLALGYIASRTFRNTKVSGDAKGEIMKALTIRK